jgi:MFS family permease
MTPIAGKLSDIFGKKRVLLVIMIVYAARVPIAGFSTNISTMLIALGLQGVGILFPIAISKRKNGDRPEDNHFHVCW